MFAALRLITREKRVGCSTGVESCHVVSQGDAPFADVFWFLLQLRQDLIEPLLQIPALPLDYPGIRLRRAQWSGLIE